MTKPLAVLLAFALSFGTTVEARAGMGAVLPKYHPKPCSGDECRADDPRSGATCTGFICTFSSAKGMQRPITAAEAAELEKARQAAIAANAAAAAAPLPAPSIPRKTRPKRTTKTLAGSKPKAKATASSASAPATDPDTAATR